MKDRNLLRLRLWSVDTSTEWLSWAKVIAIAAVVAIHTVGYNAVVDGARQSNLGRFAIAVDAAAVFCVPLFVMVSGALLLNPERFSSTRAYYRKRALRIIPALLFWHLFYWIFLVVVLDADVSPARFVINAMNGRLYTGLYYFWIVLGLVAIVPLLIPWISQTRRRHVAVAGFALAGIPALTVFTHDWRGGEDVWVETAWTWWIFYTGLFLLGWAFRSVVLTRRWTLVGLVGILALAALFAWVWRNPSAPQLLARILKGDYYGGATCIYAILVFVVLHSLIAHYAVFSALVRGRAARLGRTLGDATLGVFVLHGAVLVLVIRSHALGTDNVAPSGFALIARYLVVLGGTYAVILVARRIPWIRNLT